MKNLFIILVITMLTSSIYGGEKKFVYSDTTFNGIDFSEITFSIDKKTNDTSSIKGLLNDNQIINGIPCHGRISFNANWQLKSLTVSDNYAYGKYTFPKDCYVQFDMAIDKLEHYFAIRNGGVYRVNICKFPTNQKIAGIVCKSNEEIIYDNKWNLLACILGETDTVAGNTFEKETFIRFDKEEICCYCLYEPEIQSYKCKGDNYTAKLWSGSTGIKLYSSGKLKYFQPADDVEIQGVICKPSGSRGGVHLYENGNLKECTSARDQTIDGVFCGKCFNISFDESGKITNSGKEKIFN